jgi:hypothetical protein
MRKLIWITLIATAWLLADPALEFRVPGWLEVGAPPALAQAQVKKRPSGLRHRAMRRVRGSSTPVQSNAPGLYPMQNYASPAAPNTTGSVVQAPPIAGYPQVPTTAILPRGSTGGAGAETYSDKVVRCTHQAGLGGLQSDQQSAYITNCAQ